MSKPQLQIDVLPGLNGQVFYLPLAAKAEGETERLKIAVRLTIKHIDTTHPTLTINNITFSFPGTSHDTRNMKREPQYISPAGGVLSFGETATWSNGSVESATGEKQYNQVYLDAPAPKTIKINVHCDGFTEPASETFDLIAWRNPTGYGALRIPFSVSDLDDDEYVVTSAVHWYNGGANGTQIFAHDITIQALVNGEWTKTYLGTANENSDVRGFGRPVRAMATGEVLVAEDLWSDNPYGSELTGPAYGSNNVWVRYGNIEVNYRHLRGGSIVVSPGQMVSAGAKIAELGNSGNTSGSPHLHLECRVSSTDTLCGFAFKYAWQVERDQVPTNGGPVPYVFLDSQGICEETAAIRPFPTSIRPQGIDFPKIEFEAIVAEVLGGVAQDGGGFVIVNGKLIRVPPRGTRWELLNAIADVAAAEELNRGQSARTVRQIADRVSNIAQGMKATERVR